jgi:hypothetical protein
MGCNAVYYRCARAGQTEQIDYPDRRYNGKRDPQRYPNVALLFLIRRQIPPRALSINDPFFPPRDIQGPATDPEANSGYSQSWDEHKPREGDTAAGADFRPIFHTLSYPERIGSHTSDFLFIFGVVEFDEFRFRSAGEFHNELLNGMQTEEYVF